MPLPTSLVEKNGSKILAITSAVMPTPVSSTSISTYSPAATPSSASLRLSRSRHVARADGERAAVGHGVARIDGQVDDHLVELRLVGLDVPEVAAGQDLELDLLAQARG